MTQPHTSTLCCTLSLQRGVEEMRHDKFWGTDVKMPPQDLIRMLRVSRGIITVGS